MLLTNYKIIEMKKYIYIVIAALLFAGATGCDDAWNNHYTTEPETVNQNVWNALKNDVNASKFVALVEKYQLDTIFDEQYNDVYTLFVPTNEAIDQYTATKEITENDVAYHIAHYFIQPNNISGQRKIQTLLLKFAQFENSNNQLRYDNNLIAFSSPLYLNGRYFTLEKVASPKPSLYEYIAAEIPILKKYIDEQDSIILDKELSKPLGFDENNNTIYDSVITVINLFEEEFFEVSEEFRLKTATLVFPRKEIYEQALTEMALKIGGNYKSYEDISEDWQKEVLLPFLLEKGIFENQREIAEFQKDTLRNILNDDVIIDYRPVDKIECSNGYSYNYANFEILDSLYLQPLRTEGESLLRTLGKDRYTWSDSVSITSDETFVPDADNVSTASNDSILKILFPTNYKGKFVMEFKTKPLFPRRYLLVVRSHMDYGGIYDIYVNDLLVKTFDYYDFVKYKGIISSSVDGVRFKADGRYNKFDFWVDNITEYGKAKIRIEYKGPGQMKNNGLILDYIECVTEDMIDQITKNPSEE